MPPPPPFKINFIYFKSLGTKKCFKKLQQYPRYPLPLLSQSVTQSSTPSPPLQRTSFMFAPLVKNCVRSNENQSSFCLCPFFLRTLFQKQERTVESELHFFFFKRFFSSNLKLNLKSSTTTGCVKCHSLFKLDSSSRRFIC